ncbi:MAG: 30S ribosomal protein S2 [Anaerolineae bacterium]
MPVISMKALLETGVHFGHRTRRWNPKMAQYIFTERNGIHILDLQQTIVLIDDAYNFIRDTVAAGGNVLFVGTKRQAQDTIAKEAQRAGQPYINQRWLGGTLTNWTTIRQRLNHLDKLEKQRDAGEWEGLKKKERLMLEREINKLMLRLGGLRNLTRLPEAVFVVDVNNEDTAVLEANKRGVPVVGMVDTNCNPDLVDLVIPANDDAIRAIKLICSRMADAALEGINMRQDASLDSDTPSAAAAAGVFDGVEGDIEDSELLGDSTRAHIESMTVETVSEEPAAEAAPAAEAPAEEAAAPVEAAPEATEEPAAAEEAAASEDSAEG